MVRFLVGMVLLCGVVMGTGPGRAAAQQLDLRLTPRGGVVTPADWLFEEYKRFGANPLQWTRGAVQKSILAGLVAELEVGGSGLWVRGEVLSTLDGETSLTHTVYTPPSLAGPAATVVTRYVIPSTLLMGTLDVGLPTAFRLPGGVQPYVTAGIGAKHYTFDTSSVQQYEDDLVLPEDGTTLLYNVGGGATFRLFGIGFDLLLRDAINSYWNKTQHDVMLLGGVTWTLF